MSQTCQCLDETPCCGVCYGIEDVRILPAKKGERFIGQFFICGKCAKGSIRVELKLSKRMPVAAAIAA